MSVWKGDTCFREATRASRIANKEGWEKDPPKTAQLSLRPPVTVNLAMPPRVEYNHTRGERKCTIKKQKP